MNKYTKIVSFDVGTERPTIEYCDQLEAAIQDAMNNIGIPHEGYPACIGVAYEILKKSLEVSTPKETDGD